MKTGKQFLPSSARRIYLPEETPEGKWLVKITDLEGVPLGIIECPTQKSADVLVMDTVLGNVDPLSDDYVLFTEVDDDN